MNVSGTRRNELFRHIEDVSDLDNLEPRVLKVEELSETHDIQSLRLAQKQVLPLREELFSKRADSSDSELHELFTRVDEAVGTLLAKLYFAEKDFFRACYAASELTSREQREEHLSKKYNFISLLERTEKLIGDAKISVETGKGLGKHPELRKAEMQQELSLLENNVHEIRENMNPKTEVSQEQINSPTPSPEHVTRNLPSQAVKEKTTLEKIGDFFSDLFASIKEFFSRLFS